MKGTYRIRVKNNRNSYIFELKRNITVLRGESGRGKTTLFDMIREFNRFGKNSGVAISCDRRILAIEGNNWEKVIEENKGTIIVIDEDSSFIRSKDFARVVKGSDNYFLLITRNYLVELPFSVDEIYELEGEKNKKFKKVYTEIDHMYDKPLLRNLPFTPEIIITEDGRSGYQFFESLAENHNVLCLSAEGKGNIYKLIGKYPDKNIIVIADGAAFGSEMGDIVSQQMLRSSNLALFLPESFEWLILKSGIVSEVDMDQVDHAEKYAESIYYMSWEQYFYDLLTESTKNSDYKRYKKTKLPEYYLNEKCVQKIRTLMKGIRL